MSYILDALRKADAQRERDATRGIHAQPANPGRRAREQASGSRVAMGAAVGVGILLIAAAGWYLSRPSTAQMDAMPAPPPNIVARAPAPLPTAPAPEIAPPPVRMASPPVQAAPPVAMPPPPVQPAPAMASTTPAAAAPAASAPAPVVGSLPADAPRMAITGGVYSPSPAQRMLIVNGQVFNEGSEVAPGVTLEKIDARTATLRFRGGRYTVAY